VAETSASFASAQTSTPAQAQIPAAQRDRQFFARFPLHTGPLTALQYIELIRAHIGAPADGSTEDYVIAGDPTMAVTGIATTVIGTFDCLRRAAASGKNLIVTREPIFWADNDNLDRLEGNAEFKVKRDFIRSENLVCFHLLDHWPAQGPRGIAVGMAKGLDWETYVLDPESHTHFKLPPTTLLGLAQELATKLNDRTMRIIGDPKLPVTNVVASWGNAAQIPTMRLLNEPVDVVLAGYTHEWEAVEYVQDMIAAGQKKGMILLGEFLSEQAGMNYCADWLKTLIPDQPVEFIPVAEPYWNLHHPVSRVGT
jgi:putative NIF3 family GTP cyclohydrolase 1 type 2